MGISDQGESRQRSASIGEYKQVAVASGGTLEMQLRVAAPAHLHARLQRLGIAAAVARMRRRQMSIMSHHLGALTSSVNRRRPDTIADLTTSRSDRSAGRPRDTTDFALEDPGLGRLAEDEPSPLRLTHLLPPHASRRQCIKLPFIMLSRQNICCFSFLFRGQP